MSDLFASEQGPKLGPPASASSTSWQITPDRPVVPARASSAGLLTLVAVLAGLTLGVGLIRILPAHGDRSPQAAPKAAVVPALEEEPAASDPRPEAKGPALAPSPAHHAAANDRVQDEPRPTPGNDPNSAHVSTLPLPPSAPGRTTGPIPLPSLTEPDRQEQRYRALTADAALERRLDQTEDELRAQLQRVPELRLLTNQEIKTFLGEDARHRIRRAPSNAPLKNVYPFNVQMHQELSQRAARAGLSLISEDRCRLDAGNALAVEAVSRELRALGFVSVPGVRSRITRTKGRTINTRGTSIAQGSPEETIKAFKQWCDEHGVERGKGSLSTLVQMLQVENETTRLLLVRELARSRGADGSAALAGRALMDLSPKVRQAAVAALKRRPAEEYQHLLLEGYTYPWPAVADHAAEALSTLDAKDMVPQLVGLLDQVGPSVPVLNKATGKRTVRELVRLNHLQNCLLCHVPSVGPQDGLVRGHIPQQGISSPAGYYHPPEEVIGTFVRADTTFLRQDFSVCLPAARPGRWPTERFDFVVRKRIVPANEKPEATGPVAAATNREAIEYTLRRLTSKDGGGSSARWKELTSIPVLKPTPSPGETSKKPTPPSG